MEQGTTGASGCSPARDIWRLCSTLLQLVQLGGEKLGYFAIKCLLPVVEGGSLELLAYPGGVVSTLCHRRKSQAQ